ncbi:hypothetical protein MYXO_02667 [Myxococcaceae bacterium]|nr:hypothetical protein MYXO_02667 [Myxococcaceae bacterium]
MVKLRIDFEFPSRGWWESGGQELWEGIAESADASSVIVDENLAESWIAEARRLPGWDDGHEYAPHPVRVTALEEEDEL